MKKVHGIVILVLCFLFAGCGKKETQYYDIVSEEQPFFDAASANAGSANFQAMQFYQGEPVQIWTVREGANVNIYLYGMDGSRTILLEGAPEEYARGYGYIDNEGNYYHWTADGNISKTDSSGKRLFSKKLSGTEISRIESLCQSADGRIYVLFLDSDGGMYNLGILDSSTGEISKVNNGISSLSATTCIGSDKDGLCYLKEYGVEKVNVEAGSAEELWPFKGTTYLLEFSRDYPVWGFQIGDDGSLELLRAGRRGENGIVETLRKEPVGEGREFLTLRGSSFGYNPWLKECVSLFNRENDEWYVVLEECGPYAELMDDYAMQTSIEIAAGKGPDIIYGDVLQDYAAGVLQKGGFADLSPYLDGSGMKENDFFPWAFGRYRDGGKIYSVTPRVDFARWGHGRILMDAAVLGREGEPDIEMLMDSLLNGKEDAVFMMGVDSDELLDLFLEGSENLWGMVDWENGTCSFDTELFCKIMEAAKRFGDHVPLEEALLRLEEGEQPLAEMEYCNLYYYLDQDLMREMGKVQVGILFDDGCHAYAVDDDTVMINANSDNKEGAWEFIRFLLKEGQPAEYDSCYPAERKTFDAIMEKELAKGLYVDNYERYYKQSGLYLLTEERIQGIREILEDARFLPLGTQPILDIIHEEAQTYFIGTKTVEEVCALINNRVQVYLDENSN